MTDVHIVTEPLGGSPLSKLLQSGAAPRGWLARVPASPDEWREHARQRVAEGGGEWSARLAALAPALQATGAAAERLERVRREGGVVVTTGQQPGLFGGPFYTWSKAVSALALADAIQASTGVATAAVYWAATDDADFAEASSTVVARVGGSEVLRAPLAPPPGTPMSLAPLGDLGSELLRLRDASGSAADPRPLGAVDLAYARAAGTHGGAFVELLRAVLAPLGMPVLDASHPAVQEASTPTVEAALRSAAAVESTLAARAAELQAAGHSPQVERVAGLSLAFVRDGSAKRRLTIAEGARRADRALTPNVLLRPIVERAILPTVAYVAGPGELAYFAQVSAVAAALGVPTPVAVPRWSCTLIEPHIQQLLDRFGVTPGDLAAANALEGQLARGAMSDTTARALADLRETIALLPDALGEESEPSGLDRAVVGAVQSLEHRVDRLERRLLAGVKRRETALMQDAATLRAALYPRGMRQERLLNPIPIFSRHGLLLLSEMMDAARPHAASLVGTAVGRSS
jgi:bacillithiol biosynthesis cysteine-adding enzyme BshC